MYETMSGTGTPSVLEEVDATTAVHRVLDHGDRIVFAVFPPASITTVIVLSSPSYICGKFYC